MTQRCYYLLLGLTLLLGSVTTAHAAAPPGRYTFPANGTVFDTRTKLTWQQQTVIGTYSRSDAIAYCAALSLAGTDWRLPNVRELLTLVDPTTSHPAIDRTAFPNTPAEIFWSSSPYVGSADTGWIIYFQSGYADLNPTTATNRVRCVR